MDQGQYDAAAALLKPLVARNGRASAEGAAASYLLAYVLFDGGQYAKALVEATALQREVNPDASALKDHAGALKDGLTRDGLAPETVAGLVNDLRPLAAQETRLVALAAQTQKPALSLSLRGDLAAFRGRFDEAADLYVSAYTALGTDRSASPATRLRVEKLYMAALLRRPYSQRAAVAPLALRLLTADGASASERRLGLLAATAFSRQPPVALADKDLPDAAHAAVSDLLGTHPATNSGFIGGYIMALCRDAQGGTWVGTEGQGVWHFDPRPDARAAEGHWTQFTAENTGGILGDDAVYALCCDQKGRIWAGTLRHGVCVFNGRALRSYGPREGLAGSRVFAAACCPLTGDVWLATEGGLSRYMAFGDRWVTYSVMDGLPSNAVNSLAFGADGTVYAGTQADGVTAASPAGGYKHWRTIPGPARAPGATGGEGLPSAQVNCLLVSRGGTVYVGTDDGLARSEDGGHHWRYLRGGNAPDRIANTYTGRVDGAMVSGVEILSAPGPDAAQYIAVAAGRNGAAAHGTDGYFAPDDDPAAGSFIGGTVKPVTDPVDLSSVSAPAPAGVYQAARYGTFSYTSPALKPGETYWVRLDFAEAVHDGPGQRVFDVFANGLGVLNRFDVFGAAGGKNRAVMREFAVHADSGGRITLRFQGGGASPVVPNQYALLEDYVTCLAEDKAGHLWVGHRQSGVEVLDTVTGTRLYPKAKEAAQGGEVSSLLPGEAETLVAGYGFGLRSLPLLGGKSALDGNVAAAAQTQSVLPSFPSLPLPMGPPTLSDLNALVKEAEAVPPDPHEMVPHAVALEDDWVTEGDWLGRYGRYWACLCAMCSPYDYIWGAGWESVSYVSQMGPHHDPGDSLRYWVQWLYTTDPRVLEMPPTYLDSRIKKKLTDGSMPRREAEQDDHGEAYSTDFDGLGVYETITVPTGLYVLSLYDMNKDGHDGGNLIRDYRLSVRPHPSGQELSDLTGFQEAPEWAHGRVTQFWNGVWKRFLVRGPVTLTVEVGRNHSYTTLLPAVTLDLVDEQPPPYFGTVDQWEEVQAHHEEQRKQAQLQGRVAPPEPAATEQEAADRLLDVLGKVQFMNSRWWSADSRQFYAPLLRWYTQAAGHISKEQQKSFDKHLATCCYQMGQYQTWEEEQKRIGLTPARDVEKALRWDGVSDGGQGYEVVNEYLARRVMPSQPALDTTQFAKGKH